MSFCRHGTDLSDTDCINCEGDEMEFDDWWADRLSKCGMYYCLAKNAWDAAMAYRDQEIKDGGDWPEE